MKVGFDVTLVVTACILSLVFTGRLQGVREGTVAAALMVGLIAKQFGKVLSKWELGKIDFMCVQDYIRYKLFGMETIFTVG